MGTRMWVATPVKEAGGRKGREGGKVGEEVDKGRDWPLVGACGRRRRGSGRRQRVGGNQ